MNKIYYHSNEFFLLRNFPKDPIKDGESSWNREQYYRNIEACIADKTRIDNPELLKGPDMNRQAFFLQVSNSLKDGLIFDLPDNVEFEEGEEFIANDHWFPIDLKDKYEGKTILHRDDLEDLRKSGRTRRVIHIKLKEEDDPFEDMVKNNPTVVRYDDDANL